MKTNVCYIETIRNTVDKVANGIIYLVGLIFALSLYVSTAHAFTYGDSVYCTPAPADLRDEKEQPIKISFEALKDFIWFEIERRGTPGA
jgi:hypothetical protein